ncbi:hypothetical protein DE146DRAFT_505209 [Phaeosphaeria sp. MPI-PUGE-AT-0046c]|nr:hypothetical protein DE146DRAFT_505209 [Phaeosphaeria sp. MPI-PUGE-AT-0046c]
MTDCVPTMALQLRPPPVSPGGMPVGTAVVQLMHRSVHWKCSSLYVPKMISVAERYGRTKSPISWWSGTEGWCVRWAGLGVVSHSIYLAPPTSSILTPYPSLLTPRTPHPAPETNSLVPLRLFFDKRYHQMIYNHGHQRFIVEARRSNRRPRGISANGSGPSHRCIVLDGNNTMSLKHLSSNNPSGFPSTKTSTPAGGLALASSRDERNKVSKVSPTEASAIFEGSTAQYLAVVGSERRSRSQKWEEPTPPPTPRLDRLPSPELPDLAEAPFCDCDEATIVSYCTSCKKQAALR